MILGLELTLLFYVTLAALFRLLANLSASVALSMLIAANVLLLAALNVSSLVYVSGQIVLVLILYPICRALPKYANRISWISFIGLIPFNIRLWWDAPEAVSPFWEEIGFGPEARIIWVAGSAFFVVKSFVCLRECLRENKLQPLPMLAGLTFLPAYTAGPIFGLQPFKTENISRSLDVKGLIQSVMQLGWGLAAFYTIAPVLRKTASETHFGTMDAVIDGYINFAALFFDFSGYSLTAIAIAAFFGVKLPQNFNKPYLATSIREFWQRWHMSLSWFVSTYLFKPFVRFTGSPRKGIFLSFVLVGLWHEFLPGYLLWGIGHGYALSLAMKPPLWWQRLTAQLPRKAVNVICWALTMTWVALLSDLAQNAF